MATRARRRPVCLLAATYAEVKDAFDGCIGGLGADERAAILGGTATRVYGLRPRH
jgi:L-fuconolactonase